MKLGKNKTVLSDFQEAVQHEWIETNGLGGWSGSSIIGCNTRRYHGLLVAATKPPSERMVLVSKLEETLVFQKQRIELGTNLYRDEVVHPRGYTYMESFSRDLFPEWILKAGDLKLKKTIGMKQGQNTSLVMYEVLDAPGPFRLELRLFISVRSYHGLMRANVAIDSSVQFSEGLFYMKAYNGAPEIYVQVPGSEFHAQPCWYYHFNYALEKYRGLDFEEDLFVPGYFSVELGPKAILGIIVSTGNPSGQSAVELMREERQRKESLLPEPSRGDTFRQLVLAADQFIVKKGGNMKTIIAGYHWFTDWGRDSMISLPGLCLSTGRFEDANKILSAFARSVSQGMLPNRFPDNSEPPEYNNADGTLWYFVAVYKYFMATGDRDFVLRDVLPVLKEIIDWHFRGTRYNIHVDKDGLLFAGEEGQQLTWMDARIGDWVVTPRMGKPVEIQALWFNALKIFSLFLNMNGQKEDADLVEFSAEKAKESFLEKFWNADGGYLYDYLDEQGKPNAEFRPNQLFAISLPYELIEGDRAQKVVEQVEQRLYTAVGLRSLAPEDPHYVGSYGGDAYHRDSSYHQGTVWSWLLGPFIDAIIKSDPEKGRIRALESVQVFAYHLNEGGIGTVSEIMDAEGNHHPRGCVAQAWGVGEILRVIRQYGLFEEFAVTSEEGPAIYAIPQ